MQINVDAKALEWNVACALSGDSVGCQEIIDNVDFHEENRVRFNLPERRIAKIFLFRLIYGGSAWSYANDPMFNYISRDADFWQEVIDSTYTKYHGLQAWHDWLMREVMRTGRYESPSGRFYEYTRYKKGNEWKWPRTTILNYPVQGLAADIMAIARVSLFRRMREKGYKSLLVNTIHDSILVDSPPEEWYNISMELKNVFEDLPANYEKLFKEKYPLPLRCEIEVDGKEFSETKNS